MKKKTKWKWVYFLIGIVLLSCFFYFQNNSLVTSEYTIRSDKLSEVVNGYKIIQLSDLHNKSFGDEQKRLVERVKKEQPDLILFTGDLVDSNRYDEKPSLVLMEKLVRVAPVYYVTGNHEWRSGKFHSLEDELKNIGVQVMRNATEEIAVGTEKFHIVGIDDPANVEESYAKRAATEKSIATAREGVAEDSFQLLLAHRPEMFSLYSEYGFDVVFSGHAHGGQVRIPFAGGLIAPGQGLFPELTDGKHQAEDTTMIVNRGLGNSVFPLRIFNRPEIVVVTLVSVPEEV